MSKKRIIERLCYSFLFRVISRNAKFKLIHRFNLWGSAESVSGPGSETHVTESVRRFMIQARDELHVTSILDIPCGDFNWMRLVDLHGVQYLGADIVPDIIRKNNALYGNAERSFRVLDAVAGPFPQVDLIMIRDLFIHLSVASTWKVLENVKQSGSRYLLTTTFPDNGRNINIPDGYNYNINLECEPFSFPRPLMIIEERELSGSHGRKSLGLWTIATDLNPANR